MVQYYMKKDKKIDATTKKQIIIFNVDEKTYAVTWFVSMVAIYLADDNEN